MTNDKAQMTNQYQMSKPKGQMNGKITNAKAQISN
jgi:hypothetical protein